jgi:hypothetical protein
MTDSQPQSGTQEASGVAVGVRGHGEDSERSTGPLRRPRIRVACINWSHPRAPHAVVYLEGMFDRYFATWSEAIEWVDMTARRFAR